MKPKLLSLLGCILFATFSHAAEDHPALAIYTSDSMGNRSGPQAIALLWSDGRIVWSTSPTNGGPPYLHGHFATNRLTALITSLDRQEVFTDKTFRRMYLGPDSAFMTLIVDDGRRRLEMRSWHEQFERSTNLVALSSGIHVLGNETREAALQKEPAEYRRFRAVWTEIRETAATLVPKSGEPYTNSVPLPAGKP